MPMNPRTPETPAKRPRPAVLCILDGWGMRPDGGTPADDNAIALAETPSWDRYMAAAPVALLDASAEEVGLPGGQMGNSEVGHMNIGSGRVALQDLPRIDAALADGSLAENAALKDMISALKDSGGVCHLMGLLSPGGVHCHQDHMAALARMVSGAGVCVRVHAFLDGRDVPPKSAVGYMEKFLGMVSGGGDIKVATVSGRYYAMDRDKRWDRTERAYHAVAEGVGEGARDAHAAITQGYARDETDEFVRPTVIEGYAGMKNGDGILVANFRADRIREILTALTEENFTPFPRTRRIGFAARLGMVEYSAELNRRFGILFPSLEIFETLGEVVSDAGLTQLRIAETEKYAHVTFFFNGGREDTYPGEERILVQSPKVATYDLQPAMSAVEVTDNLVRVIGNGDFDLIVVNFANGDMVGHTGILEAAVKAAETVDQCLGRLEAAVIKAGGVLVITADHGNIEQMKDLATGQPHTAHTLNPVPVVLLGAGAKRLRDGRLADLAPTLLELLGLPKPDVMTGASLIAKGAAGAAQVQ